MSESPRKSERTTKGIPPKRFEQPVNMENSPSAPSSAASNQQILTHQQQGNQTDVMQALASMQRQMAQQMTTVQKLIAAQGEQTATKIANLQKEIATVSEKVRGVDMARTAPPDPDAMSQISTQSIAASNTGESLTNNSSSSQGSASHKAKLYPLPKFGGMPEEWPTFLEDFRQTTAEFEYTPLQNIIRIREALYGEAKETVESLLSSSKNVEIIVDALAQSFGRPEQLIRSQIDKVCALPYVPEGKLEHLIKFSTKVGNMVRFLQTANGKHHLSNPTLLSQLVSKLPQSKQMQWAEKCISLDRPVDLVDFCEWLNKVKQIANMVSDGLPSSFPVHQQQNPQRRPQGNSKGKAAFTTTTAKRCTVCTGDCQNLGDCKMLKELSVNDRWKKIKEMRLCFSCLKGNHQLGRCFNKKPCGIDGCAKHHNPILHKPADRVDDSLTSVASSTEDENSRRNLHAGTKNDEILFQMVPVKLYGPKKCISIFAFIDDGADATMLEWDIGKQIGLEGNKEKLKLQWLNGHFHHQMTETVNLSISGENSFNTQYEISKVYLVKNLELPTQSFSGDDKDHSHLSDIPINGYKKVKPQMILSLTHAYLTVPLETPRCTINSGPIAVKTRLGWVVYGPTGSDSEYTVKRIFHSRKSDDEYKKLETLMTEYFDFVYG
ncbi:uncharacterized protein LOC142230922 [Haematobia irritans]|uniref:uncharacterized protein LOC142230922 n=1 Tax=Haematobia irritans TaxID=7368 RepID=UPI003F503585